MPCPLPHNHYCCLLSSHICLPHLLICTCLISSPIACPPSSVLCFIYIYFFLCVICYLPFSLTWCSVMFCFLYNNFHSVLDCIVFLSLCAFLLLLTATLNTIPLSQILRLYCLYHADNNIRFSFVWLQKTNKNLFIGFRLVHLPQGQRIVKLKYSLRTALQESMLQNTLNLHTIRN